MRNFVKIYNRLERIDQLLRLECTGTAKELSLKLSISERAVFYHFGILKIFGFAIKYSYNSNTYMYAERKERVMQHRAFASIE